MTKFLFTSFLLLLFASGTQAQPSSFFTHYSTEDGLSQNTVMNILQDRKGYLWFATWDGINRFDGYHFKTYKARQGSFISLTNNRVDRMYEDSHGCLWLLTYDNRAHRFDPATETFEQVPSAGKPGSNDNILSIRVLPNGSVWLITENEGAIRATTAGRKNGLALHCEIYSPVSGLLPTLRVNRVYQDKAGNEWLLTDDGLTKIMPDGKNPPVHYFSSGTANGVLRKQAFHGMLEQDACLYFASDEGKLWAYDRSTNDFRLHRLPTEARLTFVCAVNGGRLVVTAADGSFFLYDPVGRTSRRYSPETHKELPAKPILSAYVDRASEVWFEQEEPGVAVHFNPGTGMLKREHIAVEQGMAERSRPAFHIHEDINGHLWVHPYGGGFSFFDRENNRLVPFYDEQGSADRRFSNKMHAMFSDKQGNLWLCSHSKGLEKVTFRKVPFSMMTPVPDSFETLSNEARAVCEDRSGNIWVGLKDGKVRVYDPQGGYKGYLTEQGSVSTFGQPLRGTAYFIMQDSKGIIWIATKGNGLVRAEPLDGEDTYRLSRYEHRAEDKYSLSDNNVYCVYEDRHGRIWLATFAGGINYLATDEDGRTIFINHRNRLKGYPINNCYRARFITSDNNGMLWVGTTTGAVAFDENFRRPEDVTFHHFARIPDDTKSLSNNDVHWIISTRRKELYLATYGGGLNKLVSIEKDGHGVFRSYSVADGLPSDVLLSVREDDKDNLWISTENGICKFDPSTERFENYDGRSIGFRVRFSEAASALTSGGNMLFGTSNGVFVFHPDSIRKSDYVPPIVFSRLSIANEEVAPGTRDFLPAVIDDTPLLELSHDENIFTVQYAALDYTNPPAVQYMYILDGFEKHWTFADKQRSVTYTNLPKGDYVFRVRSTNGDGVWVDNERSLRITVLPSFWETPAAYVIYVLFVLLIILVATYVLFTIYRLKHEVSVEQQVSDIKLRFFTNVSHELRTPLTLISGPVEQALKNESLPPDVRGQLTIVERNTKRMLRLVNQILDFRKIQNHKMRMHVQRVDAAGFVRRVMDNFEAMASDRRIDFVFMPEKEPLELWVDADKFEKIVFNLLSNAFKFTPEGKTIAVFIAEDEHTVSVGVQDQGVGIAEDRMGTLFVRFENLIDKNLFNGTASTGIGLSLVKELVDMHHATISVNSRLGVGSTFQIDFRKGKEHYNEDVEIIQDDAEETVPVADDPVNGNVHAPGGTVETSGTAGEERKGLMLLVEDSGELRSFLRDMFSASYRIIEAADGMEGFNKAVTYLPDIIISDVMMPQKDGISLTKELRSEMTTSHIPIILLTAKTTEESQIEGLEHGADAYITKPFSAGYLQARVENLLAQRKKLWRYYREHLVDWPADTEPAGASNAKSSVAEQPDISPNDRKFMDTLTRFMEKNMDNCELLVDDLVREVAVSRSVFFKKMKTLTGLAPVDFIKEIRMKKAAELIDTGEYNIAQVAYMVGINDPRYFSKCFKAKTGMTPTEYRDRKRG